MAESMKAKVINAGGRSTGERVLPEELFGGEVNVPLMHQVVTAQLAAAPFGHGIHQDASRSAGRRQEAVAPEGDRPCPAWFQPKPDLGRRWDRLRSEAARSTPSGCRRRCARPPYARLWPRKLKTVASGSCTTGPRPRPSRRRRCSRRKASKGGPCWSSTPVMTSRWRWTSAFRNMGEAAFTLVGSLSTYDVLVADSIVFTKAAFETFTSPKTEEAE